MPRHSRLKDGVALLAYAGASSNRRRISNPQRLRLLNGPPARTMTTGPSFS
jgi:hypothetical protein